MLYEVITKKAGKGDQAKAIYQRVPARHRLRQAQAEGGHQGHGDGRRGDTTRVVGQRHDSYNFV